MDYLDVDGGLAELIAAMVWLGLLVSDFNGMSNCMVVPGHWLDCVAWALAGLCTCSLGSDWAV